MKRALLFSLALSASNLAHALDGDIWLIFFESKNDPVARAVAQMELATIVKVFKHSGLLGECLVPPKSVTFDQLTATYVQFLRDNPEFHHYEPWFRVSAAFKRAGWTTPLNSEPFCPSFLDAKLP